VQCSKLNYAKKKKKKYKKQTLFKSQSLEYKV